MMENELIRLVPFFDLEEAIGTLTCRVKDDDYSLFTEISIATDGGNGYTVIHWDSLTERFSGNEMLTLSLRELRYEVDACELYFADY